MFFGKNLVTAFKVKVTAKVQNVSECLNGLYFLKHRTFCYKFGMVIQHHKPECNAEKFAIFKVKVTARAHVIKI